MTIYIDKNKLERFENNMFSLSSIIGQILFPIGLVLLLLSVIFTQISLEEVMMKVLLTIIGLIFTLLGLGATGVALIDNDTIWHKINKKMKWFSYK